MLAKTSKDIFLRSDLSRAEKVVYFALSTFTGRENTCFPSHKSIAKRASYSVSTVKRALLRLREMGLIMWRNCFDRDHARLRNRYHVAEPNDQVTVTNQKPIIINRFTLPFYEGAKNAAKQVRDMAASFFTPRYGE